MLFIWRSLRRLGVAPALVDDAAQEVFLVASRRLADIESGKERSFLFGTALRVASGLRRKKSKDPISSDELDSKCHPGPSPADELEQKRARVILDQVLARLGDDQRAVLSIGNSNCAF